MRRDEEMVGAHSRTKRVEIKRSEAHPPAIETTSFASLSLFLSIQSVASGPPLGMCASVTYAPTPSLGERAAIQSDGPLSQSQHSGRPAAAPPMPHPPRPRPPLTTGRTGPNGRSHERAAWIVWRRQRRQRGRARGDDCQRGGLPPAPPRPGGALEPAHHLLGAQGACVRFLGSIAWLVDVYPINPCPCAIQS